MFVYLGEKQPGTEVEKMVKKFSSSRTGESAKMTDLSELPLVMYTTYVKYLSISLFYSYSSSFWFLFEFDRCCSLCLDRKLVIVVKKANYNYLKIKFNRYGKYLSIW